MAGRPINSVAPFVVDGTALEYGAHVAVGTGVYLIVTIAYEHEGLSLAGGGDRRDVPSDYRRLGEATFDCPRHSTPEFGEFELAGHRLTTFLLCKDPLSGAGRQGIARLVEGVASGTTSTGVDGQGYRVSHLPATRRD